MQAHELKTATQKQLREARIRLTKPEFLTEYDKLPPKEKEAAAIHLINVSIVEHKLRKQKLADIWSKLDEHNEELSASVENLAKKLGNLKKAKEIIHAIAGLLAIVARIIPLAL